MASVEVETQKKKNKQKREPASDYCIVPLAQLRENPKNPRKTFDHIDELAASIQQIGQIVPRLARAHPTEPDVFDLVAGHRRFRGCEKAGVDTFRVVVKEMDDAMSEGAAASPTRRGDADGEGAAATTPRTDSRRTRARARRRRCRRAQRRSR